MSYRRRFLQGKKDTSIRALKFTATGQNSTIGYTSWGSNPTLEYSIDGKNWESWDYSTIDIISGESIYIRGNNPSGFHLSSVQWGAFTITGAVNCEGSIMYLLDYTQELLVIPNAFCFYRLFYRCEGLMTAPTLPATVLKEYCYEEMFMYCSYLAVAPELPATALAEDCYVSMFYACSTLLSAPNLPATVLATGCYRTMFQGCDNLVTLPELPATTLVDRCYERMFSYCYSLNSVTMLATDVSASNCLKEWLSGVASTGTLTKRQGIELPTGRSGIPSGWTVVEV